MSALHRMGTPVTDPGFLPMVVVAHPDDESLGVGGLLIELGQGLVVHLTDGAPRAPEDARAAGCDTREAYAALRRKELLCALGEAGLDPADSVVLGAVDQEAVLEAARLARELATLMAARRPAVVMTHTYEGGHPDHDAAALVVRAALSSLGRAGERVPPALEFPSYHRSEEEMVAGRFLPGGAEGITVVLPEDVRQAKERMLACHLSQRRVLAAFTIADERYRPMARHRFDRPPHDGQLHYETLGWPMDGVAWRQHAEQALRSLGLDPCGEPY